MDNYNPDDFEAEYYNYVTVDGDESEPMKKIFLPLMMKILCKKQSFLVASLLELSLKAVEKHHQKGKKVSHYVLELCGPTQNLSWSPISLFTDALYPPPGLPLELHTTLSDPIATCTMCGMSIFTCAYPVLFEAQIHLYRLLRLVLCCSSGCVFRAARYTLLPLVYPDPDLLFMTVALVDNWGG